MKIGIDMDGVLADFNTAFIALIKDTTGVELPPPSDSYPSVWNYHREPGGITEEQDKALWTHIMYSPFWLTLRPLKGAEVALDELNRRAGRGDEVYFITTRPGRDAKALTEGWLQWYGMENPTVLISGDKGSVAKGLGLNVFIDDKPENCNEVLDETTVWEPIGGLQDCCLIYHPNYRTRVFVMDAPYNRQLDRDGITRISSVLEALDQETSVVQVAA